MPTVNGPSGAAHFVASFDDCRRSGPTRRWRSWLTAGWLLSFALPALGIAPDQDIVVHVQKTGPEVVLDVECPVRAPVALVWEVLTDYDNMARFLSNIQYSAVQTRVDNVLTVRQAGKATRGPFSYAFDNVREIELVPYTEIHSRLLSGDFKASVFTTRIVEVDGFARIVNTGRYIPNIWVPPFIGPALIETETRKQFGEIRAEIMRRIERKTAGLDSAR